MYFDQLESFPESKYKDMVDAGSSAFAELELHNVNSAFGDASDELEKQSHWRNI